MMKHSNGNSHALPLSQIGIPIARAQAVPLIYAPLSPDAGIDRLIKMAPVPTVSAGLELWTADTSSLGPTITLKNPLQAEIWCGNRGSKLRSAQLKPKY